jgi:hypothetical protein
MAVNGSLISPRLTALQHELVAAKIVIPRTDD